MKNRQDKTGKQKFFFRASRLLDQPWMRPAPTATWDRVSKTAGRTHVFVILWFVAIGSAPAFSARAPYLVGSVPSNAPAYADAAPDLLVTRASGIVAGPTIERVVTSAMGAIRVEGRGTPFATIDVEADAKRAGSPIVGADGRWHLNAIVKIATGDFVIATSARDTGTLWPVPGHAAHVALPSVSLAAQDHAQPSRIYEYAHIGLLSKGPETTVTRVRVAGDAWSEAWSLVDPTLYVGKGKPFKLAQAETAPAAPTDTAPPQPAADAIVPPVKREAPKTPAENTPAEEPAAVPAAAPAAPKPAAPPAQPAAAPEKKQPPAPSQSASKTPPPPPDVGGMFSRVQDWLARANREYQGTIVKELSRPSTGAADADAVAVAKKRELEKAAEAAKSETAKATEARKKAEELKQAAEKKAAEDAKKAAAAKPAEEQKAAEEQKKADAAKQAEAAKKAEEAKKQEAARQAEAAKQAEAAQKVEEQKRAEDAAKAAAAEKKETARDVEAEKLRAANEAARLAEQKRVDEQKRVAEEKRAEQLRQLEAKRKSVEDAQRKSDEAQSRADEAKRNAEAKTKTEEKARTTEPRAVEQRPPAQRPNEQRQPGPRQPEPRQAEPRPSETAVDSSKHRRLTITINPEPIARPRAEPIVGRPEVTPPASEFRDQTLVADRSGVEDGVYIGNTRLRQRVRVYREATYRDTGRLARGPAVKRWVWRAKYGACSAAGRKAYAPRRYVVRRGDSLWRISERHYNAGRLYSRIYRANRDRIRDPDLIYPCQRFLVPRR